MNAMNEFTLIVRMVANSLEPAFPPRFMWIA
jgi:hypothetical protein